MIVPILFKNVKHFNAQFILKNEKNVCYNEIDRRQKFGRTFYEKAYTVICARGRIHIHLGQVPFGYYSKLPERHIVVRFFVHVSC